MVLVVLVVLMVALVALVVVLMIMVHHGLVVLVVLVLLDKEIKVETPILIILVRLVEVLVRLDKMTEKMVLMV
jgi:hypothetical protein